MKSGWILESCWSKLICLNTISCHVKSWSGMVCRRDSIYKFSDYSSVQHAPCCRLHHLQTEGKTKMEKNNDKRGWAAVRYSSCQAGTGSEECVGKNNRFWGEKWLLLMLFFVVLSVLLFGPTVSVFVYCTIPESMEACFLVVLGGGGGGVLLGRGGGTCCKQNSHFEFSILTSKDNLIANQNVNIQDAASPKYNNNNLIWQFILVQQNNCVFRDGWSVTWG